MRPAIRLAALMKQHVIYIYTHDSIGLGEDGPTHQPIEQLSALRAIPNLTVIRPADATETADAWRVAIEHDAGPVALVLTRQKLGLIDRTEYGPATASREAPTSWPIRRAARRRRWCCCRRARRSRSSSRRTNSSPRPESRRAS